MKKVLVSVLVVLVGFILVPIVKVLAATARVDLLSADSFAILSGSAIVDANVSVVSGNVGLSPASGSFNALPCAEVTGTIYSVDGAGPLPCRVTNAGLLTQAKTDLTTAFTDAGARTPATVLAGGDNQLGGKVLTDGVYSFSHATTANLIGTVTLDGQGNPNSVFIFQAASDFITASASVVVLTNGAQACNVFWQVPTSATFGTGSNFVGTVLADQSITDSGGSTVNGRFLARIATVTLNNTQLTRPTCATTSSTTSTASASNGNGGPATALCPGLNTQIVDPLVLSSNRISPTSIYLSWGPYSGTDHFNIQYGFTDSDWQYNTDVIGFNTTINSLPANQPIWVRIAPRSDCTIGNYGQAKFLGSPSLPNTGLDPDIQSNPMEMLIPIGIFLFVVAVIY